MMNIIDILNENSGLIQTILATTAIIISICAIALTFRQIKMQKIFNINSVRPICAIEISDFEDDVAVLLKNVGSGALRIIDFKCKNKYNESESILDLVPLNIGYWSEFTEQLNERYIGVHENFVLIRKQEFNDKDITLLRMALSEITIYVEYEDIYGTCYNTKRELKYFSRTLSDY